MSRLKARPTTYKGIKMRSRLEAGFAAWLDQSAWPDWQYEPRAFASEAGQYLPDFKIPLVYDGLQRNYLDAYVEVKPAGHLVEGFEGFATSLNNPLLERMAIIWESEPTALLLIFQPVSGLDEDAPYPVWRLVPARDSDVTVVAMQTSLGTARSMHPSGWSLGVAHPRDPFRVTSSAAGPWPDGYWEGP